MIYLSVISHFFQLRKVIIIKLQKLILKWLRSTNMVIGYGTYQGTNRCRYREIMSDMMLYYLGFEPLSLLSIHLRRRVAGPRGSYLTDKFIRQCYDIIEVPQVQRGMLPQHHPLLRTAGWLSNNKRTAKLIQNNYTKVLTIIIF